jgi:hypothetical protein
MGGWDGGRGDSPLSYHLIERGGFVDSPFISFRDRGGGDVE